MSDIFAFVESEVLIGVIRDNHIYCWSAFDFVDAINYVNVWVFSFVCAVICYEVSSVSGDWWSTDFDGYYPIVPRWYFESGSDSSNGGFLGGGMCER